MSSKTYRISDPLLEWQSFEIVVEKEFVISKSLHAPVEVGASLEALKKYGGWGDASKYKVEEITNEGS